MLWEMFKIIEHDLGVVKKIQYYQKNLSFFFESLEVLYIPWVIFF
jgi:hypothetical protein